VETLGTTHIAQQGRCVRNLLPMKVLASSMQTHSADGHGFLLDRGLGVLAVLPPAEEPAG
jgi:hypothetical protein